MPKISYTLVYCFLILFASLALSVSISDAKIFSWKDDNGKTHFTDSPANIPLKYRKGEKKGLRSIKEAAPVISTDPTANSPVPPVVQMDFSHEYKIPLIPIEGGNFMVEVTLNGKAKAILMLDTGASQVSFSPAIGEKLNIKTTTNSAKIPFQTANGVVWNYIVTLDKVKIGDAEIELVEAHVGQKMSGMDGLLGMSAFENFTMEINRAKSELILRPLAEPGEQIWDGKPALWWKSKFKSYNSRIKKYRIQVAKLAAFNDPMAVPMQRTLKYYEDLHKKLSLRASLFGVPKSFKSSE